MTVEMKDVTITDAPDEEAATQVKEDPDTQYIVHRTPDGDVRMTMDEWPAYKKEHDL